MPTPLPDEIDLILRRLPDRAEALLARAEGLALLAWVTTQEGDASPTILLVTTDDGRSWAALRIERPLELEDGLQRWQLRRDPTGGILVGLAEDASEPERFRIV